MTEKKKSAAKKNANNSRHPDSEDGIKIPISNSAGDSPQEADPDQPLSAPAAQGKTAPAPEDQPSSGDQSIEDQLAGAEARAQENYDRLLRISAEFDNYKKRTAREMSEIRKYAYEGLCRDLLTVVDNLERAMEAAGSDSHIEDSMLEGIGMTHKELLKVLEKYHVTPLESEGEAFDPNIHQAVLQEPTGDQPANTVIREFSKGYMIRERLLRPAMVVVAKEPSD